MNTHDTETKKEINRITTTRTIESKRSKVTKGRHRFKPTAIDCYKDYSSYTREGLHAIDPVAGYRRFRDPAFVIHVGRWMQKTGAGFSLARFLTTLPAKYSDYNELRRAIIEAQIIAEVPIIHVPVEKNERARDVIASLKEAKLDRPIALVLDMEMDPIELQPMIDYGKEHQEVVFLYRDWVSNRRNYLLVLKACEENPRKFHMHGVPLTIHKAHAKHSPIATLLVLRGFKSVSFVEQPMSAFVAARIAHLPEKTVSEKFESMLWIDTKTMTNSSQHPAECTCVQGQDMRKLAESIVDPKACALHHMLESLQEAYEEMEQQVEQTRVLNLESVKQLSGALFAGS